MRAITGPWYTAYYSYQGVEYWRYTFDTAGTYEVTAALNGDEQNARSRLTVHVNPTGNVAPAIEEVRPATGLLEVDRDSEAALELNVIHSNRNLDRVV
ncbi:hypothetical protein [Natronorubrum aibiense]|uniref:Uncharacterized protein n=1 Tax=Natronorubrum aibiense TaxID=348826 RepID=A0A5P9P2C6_9EURY|nr:hypothetical protein [Natronorubrum aibiense]QFU82279.1 hypothetical protein GCU68_06905 [Natronorubrum aibiense]